MVTYALPGLASFVLGPTVIFRDDFGAWKLYASGPPRRASSESATVDFRFHVGGFPDLFYGGGSDPTRERSRRSGTCSEAATSWWQRCTMV